MIRLRFKNKNLYRFVPILLFLLVLIVYSFTMPNINTGYADSDEFLAVAKIFGVAHPPSYPLYTMLAALFGRLPIPFLNFAGRINFLNVLLHSVTVIFFYYSSLLLLKRYIKNFKVVVLASALGALSLAVVFSFWFYSLFAEVFPLSNFFAALTFFILLLWQKEHQKNRKKASKYLLFAALSYGLGLSNQQAILLMAPVYGLMVLMTDWKIVKNWKLLLKSFGLLFIGLLTPYAYVYIAAAGHPVINWESANNPEKLYRIITRRIYGEGNAHGFAYSATLSKKHSTEGIIRFAHFILVNYTPLLTALGFFGMLFLLIKKEFKVFITLVSGIFGGGLLYSILAPFASSPTDTYHNIGLGVYQRFYLTSPIFYSFFVILGVVFIYELANRFFRKMSIGVFIAFLIVLLVIGAQNFKEIKKNNFELGYRYGKTLLESLEPNSILLCFSEHSCFTGVYLQQAEGIRKDVLIIPADFIELPPDQIRSDHPDILKTTTERSSSQRSILLTRDLLRWQIDKRPIYIAGIVTDATTISGYGLMNNPFYLLPEGCAMKVSRTFKVINTNPCKMVEDQYLSSYITKKAPITFMFPEYLMYQRYMNGYMYASYACGNAATREIGRAIKLSPQTLILKKGLQAAENIPKKDYCLNDTGEIQFSDVLKKAREAQAKRDFNSSLYYMIQAVELHPKDIPLRFELAQMYIDAGAFYNALLEDDDILGLEPNNEKAKTQFLKLKRAIELDLPTID